ncbi:probable receptor-like protein kinase At5g24010 [Phoenix dactylifera]|uniref:Probable receptor-like protein kinase At5g24010 n=1 Tax=Phoenix dactylifera TaxID=42345 RepID=A0A8B7CWE0_PHODC|nr:probable receptor-like protein kinase At5g24010 [Phoenix dactylifera]
MGNPRIPLFLFFCILFSRVFALSSARFSPPDNHLIACGTASASTLDDRRVFLPDSAALLRSSGSKISVLAVPDASPASSPLSRTARVFTRPSSYEFQIKQKGTHIIRLHFYPFSSRDFNLSSALFHVSASGFVLLTDFGTSFPQLKEYLVWVDAEKLVISFAPARRSSFAFVNAIEVVSAPGDLIGDTARLVNPDRIEKFDGFSRQAMETLYRLNVGGPKVTPFNDTLWRTWVPDAGFRNSDSVSKTVAFSGRIMYREGAASREVAPDNVYNTARAVDGANVSDSNSNMTWVFAVRSGYKYLIRMHFCDIASRALYELYFNVYVNGYLAYEDFDLSMATGFLASPYYVDFVAGVDSLEQLLSVSIGPSKQSNHLWINGLLNGLEIMKINNTMGSLDGESPIILVLESPARRGFGAFLSSIVCGLGFMSLLMIGFVLLLKWRAETRNTVTWLPLPTDVSGGKSANGNPVVSSKLVYF